MSLAEAARSLAEGTAGDLGRPIPLLINGRAGALKSTADADEMLRIAGECGLTLDVTLTDGPDDMRQCLRKLVAEGVKRIGVAGGDGTVGLAARELATTGVALGIIPQGTANNFATALRLPIDLPSALRVLCSGEPRDVDLGRITSGDGAGRYFNEAAGVGLFADALALYGGANKNPLRTLYAVARLRFTARPHRVRLYVDGELHSERAVMVTAANTFRIAHAVPVAPGVKLTDGELDVVVIGDIARRDFARYYKAMRAQLHTNLPNVTMLKAREVRIETRAPMNVHADDTVVGATPVTIAAAPRALTVLVDRL
jgi:diacylglycerol kinase (ATP)